MSTKNRLDLKTVIKEHDLYNKWEDVTVNLNGKEYTFGVQKHISQIEVEKIIGAYAEYLSEFSDIILAEAEDDKGIDIVITLFVHLWAFLIRFKTDILIDEKKAGKIDNNKMLQFCQYLTELNCWDQMMEQFDKHSLQLLTDKFQAVLDATIAGASNEIDIDIKKLLNMKSKIVEETVN